MCKPNSEIHFCTCASVSKKQLLIQEHKEIDKVEYEKTQFIWTLYRYLGEKDNLMMGEMIMPVDRLDEEMTSQDLLLQLNSQNLFDFDYSPSEGDNLQIRREYIYKSIRGISRPELYDYISFIYRNGNWKEEVYNVFTDKIRRFKMGIISKS